MSAPAPPLPARRARPPHARRRGFTLLEAVITVAVLAVIMAAAVPSYAHYLARQRLRHVAELLEMDLRRARTASVEEARNTYVSFESGPQWCWGVSRQGPCNCATGAPRCDMGSVDHREYKGTLLQSGQSVTFTGGLGRATGWSRIGISNTKNQQLYVDMSPLGRPQLCGTDAPKAGAC